MSMAMMVLLVVACQPLLTDAGQPQPAASTPATVAVTTLSATLSPPLATATPLPTPTLARPTPTREPLVPTLVAQPAVSLPPASPTPALVAIPGPLSADLKGRLGVSVAPNVLDLDEQLARRLGVAWFLDWSMRVQPPRVEGLEYAQMVLLRGPAFWQKRDRLAQTIAANPGALWLISNEPDVPWQDNRTPDEYAVAYHQLYLYIKSLDPTARIAAGAISQPTALRLRYLDRVWESYEARFMQPMPADFWHIHGFILREERDSWGVSIPPGFDQAQGELFEIEDHDNLEVFRQQILDFRRWMAERGQREKPLWVTEYGILMPEGYGFPSERVAAFMEGTFDFLLNASDPDVGYPADDNRLVQRLAWFVLSDTVYPTGNLVDPTTAQLTVLGEAFAAYAARLEGNP